jgi:hypothetical protein
MAKQQGADPVITADAIQGLLKSEIKRYQGLADNAVKRADRADARFAAKVVEDLRKVIFG